MNHLLNLTKKEIRELLAPGAIISIIVMMFIFIAIGSAVGNETSSASAPPVIGIANGDVVAIGETNWSDVALTQINTFYEKTYNLSPDDVSKYVFPLNVTLTSSGDIDGQQIINEMNAKGVSSALIIEPNFSSNINKNIPGTINEYYVFQNKGLIKDAVSSSILDAVIASVSGEISYQLAKSIPDPTGTAVFLLQPVNPSSQFTDVNGKLYPGIDPATLSSSISSQTMLVPIIIMIVIVMIGSMIISSMGSEKENKTLETLLTLPIKRTTVVSGKLIAAAIVGLIYGLAYMVGMYFYTNGISGSGTKVNLSDYGLGLGMTDWVLIAVMIFLAIFCALGLCMILGAFTKNYKASQTMIMPISILAIIPMFLTMFTSYSSLPPTLQGILFIIPFSHPMMAMSNLMFGNTTLVLAGIAYLLIFAIATILITVRIYSTDILLTGPRETRGMKLIRSIKGNRRRW